MSKTSLMTTVVAAAILASVAIPPAMALQKGGVKIHGNVDLNVTVKNMTGVSIGMKTKVGQSVGTIHSGTKIGGDIKRHIKAGNVVGIAILFGKSCQQIGSIGDNPACR